jgi:hypothetical protein
MVFARTRPAQPAPAVDATFDPPPVSAFFADRADYLKVTEFDHSVSRRAYTNHRRWQDRRDAAQVEIVSWLARGGHLGPQAAQAHQRYVAQEELRRAADSSLAKARLGYETEHAALVETLATLTVGTEPLPSGSKVVSAQVEVAAAEVVAEAVRRATPAINRSWGACVAAISWPRTLERVEPLADPQAQRAASWIRAKLDAGPGPDVDPVRWA